MNPKAKKTKEANLFFNLNFILVRSVSGKVISASDKG